MKKSKSQLKNVWQFLVKRAKHDGANHFVLLDPDKESPGVLADRACLCEDVGVDGLLVGGSYIRQGEFEKAAKAIYQAVNIPVILFPGESGQVNPYADAILFMSLISGRNPEFLIGQQVRGAPLVKKFGLETIPTGYILVESGSPTSVELASNTRPIPRGETDIAVAHALAAQYFGMQAVYLEAGSGAKSTVPDAMITKVAKETDLSVIVGGGIRTPTEARAKVRAGAEFIVTGTIFEGKTKAGLLKEILKAIKSKRK